MKINDLRCKCRYKDCDKLGPTNNMTKIVKVLTSFKKQLGSKYPIDINSGYRCEKHNAKVGGVKNSQHRAGLAADISIGGLSTESLFLLARKSGLFDGIGLYMTFIHVDKRGSKARWDKRSDLRKECLSVEMW